MIVEGTAVFFGFDCSLELKKKKNAKLQSNPKSLKLKPVSRFAGIDTDMLTYLRKAFRR